MELERLRRAAAKLRSDRPADWRQELEGDLLELLEHATIPELSATDALLADDRSEAAEQIWRRIALRKRLGLEHEECYRPADYAKRAEAMYAIHAETGEYPAYDSLGNCQCLSDAVDAFTDDNLGQLDAKAASAQVVREAKRQHKNLPRRRRRKIAKPKPVEAAPLITPEPLLALSAGPEPAPPPNPKQERPRLWRQKGVEPAHPLSWAAHKARRDGRIDWMTEQF
jgi:hypothetical protein